MFLMLLVQMPFHRLAFQSSHSTDCNDLSSSLHSQPDFVNQISFRFFRSSVADLTARSDRLITKNLSPMWIDPSQFCDISQIKMGEKELYCLHDDTSTGSGGRDSLGSCGRRFLLHICLFCA
jgi:hypothetical protein